MDKKERFYNAYEYLRSIGKFHTQEELADIMGASRSNVSSALAGKPKVLTDKFIQRFCLTFPGVFNMDWLLNGDGEMLKAPQMAQDGTIPYGAVNTPPDTLQLLVEQNTRLLDMIAQKDAKIDQLQKELDEIRGVTYSAKKSG